MTHQLRVVTEKQLKQGYVVYHPNEIPNITYHPYEVVQVFSNGNAVVKEPGGSWRERREERESQS